jgi:DNA-binding beta-propeller fold protein YncE
MKISKFLLAFSGAIITTGSLIFSGCDSNSTGTGTTNPYPEGILYVANQTSATVYRFDVETMTRIDSISSVIEAPHWIEFAPDGHNYYLNGRFTPAQIGKFRTADNSFVDSVTVSGQLIPTAMVIASDNSSGYICDFTTTLSPGRIHKYNLNSMTFVDSSISNGAASHDLKISSDRTLIVACSRFSDDVTLVYLPEDTVFIIPLDSTNIRPDPPVYEPYGVIIDSNDSLAYIACLGAGQVKIVDLINRVTIDSLLIPLVSHGAPTGPTLMAIAPDNGKLLVTTQYGNTVVTVELNSKVVTQIPVSAPRPFGIKRNADGSKYFVACVNDLNQPGRIYVIDGNTLLKIDSVDVGLNSFSLAWQP